MIFKIAIFIVILFLVYVIFFKKSRITQKKDERNKELEESMMECPTCTTYFSKNDGVLSNGKYYCSQECIK